MSAQIKGGKEEDNITECLHQSLEIMSLTNRSGDRLSTRK